MDKNSNKSKDQTTLILETLDGHTQYLVSAPEPPPEQQALVKQAFDQSLHKAE